MLTEIFVFYKSLFSPPLENFVSLVSIILYTNGHIFQFEVRQTSIRPYVSEVYQVRRSDGRIIVELPQPILIVGDVKIEFIQKIKMDILNLGQK